MGYISIRLRLMALLMMVLGLAAIALALACGQPEDRGGEPTTMPLLSSPGYTSGTPQESAATPTTTDLISVCPQDGLVVVTHVGDDIRYSGPAEKTYTLSVNRNASTPADWSASTDAPWLTVHPSFGALDPEFPGRQEEVTVEISPGAVEHNGVGRHVSKLVFKNEATGHGDTTRVVELVVLDGSDAAAGQTSEANPPGYISVCPQHPFVVTTNLSGSRLIPMYGWEKGYRLSTGTKGTENIRFEVTADVPWISIAPGLGSLEVPTDGRIMFGDPTDIVTVTIATNAADYLGPGKHVGQVTFTNATNGHGNTTRLVEFLVTP